jgi:hypothetical protein
MQLLGANIRSSGYLIAEVQARCPRCSRFCRVLALALPPNHETLEGGEWQKVDANAFIFYIASLPHAISRLLLERCAGFHQACIAGSAQSTWVNHCPHCARTLSDDELHCEPGAFMPSDILEAQAISLTLVEGPFSALAAGYALEPELFASMRMR